jgi:Fe-S-cluster containining protein
MAALQPPYAAFYDRWLGDFGLVHPDVGGCFSCTPCQMSDPRRLPPVRRQAQAFRADLKCCTYSPFVPNFSIGAILRSGRVEPNSDSQALVKMRKLLTLSRRQGARHLMPLGHFPDPEKVKRREALGELAFGNSEDLLCPLFEQATGLCSVWNNRPAVCSSYHCTSARGFNGLSHWAQLEDLVGLFEWTMAHEVLWRLGWTDSEIEDSESLQHNTFKGHELETFYINCSIEAEKVSSESILELMGGESVLQNMKPPCC